MPYLNDIYVDDGPDHEANERLARMIEGVIDGRLRHWDVKRTCPKHHLGIQRPNENDCPGCLAEKRAAVKPTVLVYGYPGWSWADYKHSTPLTDIRQARTRLRHHTYREAEYFRIDFEDAMVLADHPSMRDLHQYTDEAGLLSCGLPGVLRGMVVIINDPEKPKQKDLAYVELQDGRACAIARVALRTSEVEAMALSAAEAMASGGAIVATPRVNPEADTQEVPSS